MTVDRNNLAQDVIRVLRNALHPLVDLFGDDELRREVLLSLGLSTAPSLPPPNIPDPGGRLSSIDTYLAKSEPGLDDLAGALSDIFQLSLALESLIQVLTADPKNAEVTAEEALNLMVSALTVGYMRNHHPQTYAFMRAVGLIADEAFHLDRLGSVLQVGSLGFGDLDTETDARRFSNTIFLPSALVLAVIAVSADLDGLQAAYSWEPSPGSPSPIADLISDRMLFAGGSLKGKTEEGGAGGEIATTWALVPKDHQGVALVLGVTPKGKVTLKLGKHWKLELDGGTTPFVLRMGEGGGVTGSGAGKLKLKVGRDSAGKLDERWLLGDPKGSRLEISAAEIAGQVSDKDIGLEAAVKETRLFFKVNSPIFPSGEWSAQFNLGLGYSKKRKFYLGSGSGLEIDLPVSATVGSQQTGLTVQTVTLGLKGLEGERSGLELETSISASFTLFEVFRAVVQRIGLLTKLYFPAENGRDLDLELEFRPPMGIGLELDLGFMVGGGFIFLDPDNGSYAGILHFEFREMKIGSLTAVGLLNTRLPDGTDIVSLMLIITVRFPPPYVQLTWGFTLNGLGLILGVNRTADSARLAAGVRDRTIENVLFPVNPIQNAVRVINDVRQVFPPARGRQIFGGIIALGWGGIIEFDAGLLLEFNQSWEPARFVLLGVLKINVPTKEAAIIAINAALVGVFDSDGVMIAGSLYESRIAFLNISGDMLMVARGGERAVFLLSVGGFHPAFTPPADIPTLRRITLGMAVGDVFRLTVEHYFAVTSNTVQFGSKTELYIGVDAFNVYGYISFDALFQFDPFEFRVELRAGLAVRTGSTVIMSIELTGVFSGPNPFTIEGKGRFKILFFSFSVNVRHSFGDKQAVPSLFENVQQRLVEELSKDENWQAVLPDNRSTLVTLREEALPGRLVVNPFGALQVSQKLVPLAVKLDHFYNARVEGADQFDLTALTTAAGSLTVERAEEQFARAQFQEMGSADKLSSPSFEQMKAGLRANAGALIKVNQALTREVTYERSITDPSGLRCWRGFSKLFQADLESLWSSSPAALSSLATQRKEKSPLGPPKVTVTQDSYAVVRSDSLTLVDAQALKPTYAEASSYLSNLTGQNQDGELIIVPFYEVQG